jgi:hypothetical protein
MATRFRPTLLFAAVVLVGHLVPVQSQGMAGLRVKTDAADVEVWLDGEPVGRTPLTLRELSTGKHRLTLLKDGYEDYLEDVEVAPGKTNSVFVVMKPRSMKLPDLPAEFRIVNAGLSRKYEGTLTVSAEALDYKSDNGEHQFHVQVADIKSVVRAMSPVIGGMVNIKSPNSKELMAIRLEAAGRRYIFIAFKETRKDRFEVANEKTRELYDIIYRLWFAAAPPQKSRIEPQQK